MISGYVIAIVATTDGNGYWIACSTGGVFDFGDALLYGSANASAPWGLPIVAMAATPDGGGVLARRRATDRVRLRRRGRTGDLRSGESHIARRGPRHHPRRLRRLDGRAERHRPQLRHRHRPQSAHRRARHLAGHLHRRHAGCDLLVAPVPERQLRLRHQLAPVRQPQGRPRRSLSPARRLIPRGPSTTPSPSSASTDGPSASTTRACRRRSRWAAKAQGTGGAPYDLYMFLNSPSSYDTIDQQGPAGTCSQLSAAAQPGCLAYNYGYNAAQAAVSTRTPKVRRHRCGGSTWRTTSAASTGRATRR